MSATDGGGPAFPNPALANEAFQPPTDLTGMTLRDYFAAKAMAAYVGGCITAGLSWSPNEVAKEAHNLADAMLKARQQ